MNFFYQGTNIKFSNLSMIKKVSRTKNKSYILSWSKMNFFIEK